MYLELCKADSSCLSQGSSRRDLCICRWYRDEENKGAFLFLPGLAFFFFLESLGIDIYMLFHFKM